MTTVDYCKPICKTVSLHAKISAYLDNHNYDLHLSIHGDGDRCGHLCAASLLRMPPGQAVFCQLLWEEDLQDTPEGTRLPSACILETLRLIRLCLANHKQIECVHKPTAVYI